MVAFQVGTSARRPRRWLVNRGDVWWVDLPDQKRRPYMVLTRNAAVGVLTRILAVPATSTIRNIASEVPLGPDDGMPKSCVLSFDNIETIPKWACTEFITSLSATRLHETCRALNIATDCRQGPGR